MLAHHSGEIYVHLGIACSSLWNVCIDFLQIYYLWLRRLSLLVAIMITGGGHIYSQDLNAVIRVFIEDFCRRVLCLFLSCPCRGAVLSGVTSPEANCLVETGETVLGKQMM